VTRLAAVLAVAVVGIQATFDLWYQLHASDRGELRVRVPQVSINDVGSPFTTLVNLPLGDRRAIVEALVRDLGVSPERVATAVHGAVLGLAQHNRPLLAWSSRHPDGPDRPPDEIHYLVAKAVRANVADAEPRWQSGAYAIVAYRPHIDYAGWRCAVTSTPPAPEAAWSTIALPTSSAHLAVAPGEHLACRGRLRARTGVDHALLAVSAIGWAPFDAAALDADGRAYPPVTLEQRQEPLMLETATGWDMGVGWATETTFTLHDLVAGEHEMTIELTGTGVLVGLDVDEGRSW
jgi:hypothetical protein